MQRAPALPLPVLGMPCLHLHHCPAMLDGRKQVVCPSWGTTSAPSGSPTPLCLHLQALVEFWLCRGSTAHFGAQELFQQEEEQGSQGSARGCRALARSRHGCSRARRKSPELKAAQGGTGSSEKQRWSPARGQRSASICCHGNRVSHLQSCHLVQVPICEPCAGSHRRQRGTYPPVTLLGGGRVLSTNRLIRHPLRDTGAPPIQSRQDFTPKAYCLL